MKISLIFAVAANGVIGRGNSLPWRLRDDLRFFVQKTQGHHVIMGRKQYESVGHSLPRRPNLVISRNPAFQADCPVVPSLARALELARAAGETEAFIIGGGEIYALFMPVATKMILTHVDASPDGEAFFPEWRASEWHETERTHHAADEKHAHAFDIVRYERV